MRKVALAVAFLSATAVAGCGDDLPSTVVDANPMVDGGPGGNTGEVGPLPDAGCPSATFITPVNAAKLTAADDVDDQCKANGFQIDVKLAVGAPDGTPVTLLANNTPVGTPGVVTGGTVTFAGVSLATKGASALVAQIGTAMGCSVTNTIDIDCSAITCNITKPVISEAHPKLNDVPVAEGGDRVSSPGSDYQAAFEVVTTAVDNSVVQLQVRRADAPDAVVNVNATVLGGKANFPGVALRPDGAFQIQAICKSGAVEGRSQLGTFTVDTAKPDLTVTSPTMGQFFGPTDLLNGKFKVCASTTSADAVALGMATPRMGKNFGAGVGNSLEFAAVTAAGGGGGTGCVELACNGGAPFDLNVSLFDDAGNKTTKVVQGVRCASALPSVQIVAPAGDVDPYLDVSKRLLANSSAQALKDLNPNKAGAQTNVVACTDKAGSTAVLKAGLGEVLNLIGSQQSVQAAQPQDGCTLGYVVKWTDVTLPESAEKADGSIEAATSLVVEVTDVSTAVGVNKPATRLWVDSQVPALKEQSPSPLCGRIYQSAVDVSVPVNVISGTSNLTFSVVGPNETKTYPIANQFGLTIDFGSVTFAKGNNEVAVSAEEPSGNKAAFPSPCTVKVGEIPTPAWITPAVGTNLCAKGSAVPGCLEDADAATAGWQGALKVAVSLAGGPATAGTVTFQVNGTDVGVATLDPTGVATVENVSIPDAPTVTLKVVTSEIGAGGTGSLSRTVGVDTTPPSGPTDLQGIVKNRRATSFHLAWKGASDAGSAVTGYLVKVGTSPITDATAFAAAESVSYSGTPSAPDGADGMDVLGRRIATDYFFGIVAVDAVGNRSSVTSVGPLRADFFTTTIGAPDGVVANERFGNSIDGAEDLDGDGRSDLLVGSVTGQRAYIYFGASDPTDLSTPAKRRITILKGTAGTAFGRSFINIGDINGDKKNDIAISASRAGSGKVYVFKGRTAWNAEYDVDLAADYIIELGAAYANTGFGETMARIGNFDGDSAGTDDFAIGAATFNGGRGRVVVVLGSTSLDPANLNVVMIDGDATQPAGRFGERLTGLGKYYSGSGTTLVAASLTSASNSGRVFTFQGLTPTTTTGTPYSVDVAKHSVTGPAGSLYGIGLGVIGTSGAAAGLAVGGDGAASGLGYGFVDVWNGPESTGPFSGTPVRLGVSAASGPTTDFAGRLVFGSVVSGSSVATSILGDSTPDLVVVPLKLNGGPSSVYILDGSRTLGLASPADIVAQAAVKIPLPSDWQQVANYQRSGIIRDIDGDGAPDIAVGEYSTGISPAPAIPGRIFLIW